MYVPMAGGALCATPEMLEVVDAAFDRPGGPAARHLQEHVCPRCPVAAECLAAAVEHGEHGPWGGTSRKLRCNKTGVKPATFNIRRIR